MPRSGVLGEAKWVVTPEECIDLGCSSGSLPGASKGPRLGVVGRWGVQHLAAHLAS